MIVLFNVFIYYYHFLKYKSNKIYDSFYDQLLIDNYLYYKNFYFFKLILLFLKY